MKKTRELKGMPVLTLQEGERLGQVRDLILDPAARQVVALVLDRRAGKEDQVVATANIHTIGAAAITVESRSSLVPLSRIPRFQELARNRRPLQGKMVISEQGTRLGQVDDVEVDPQTFQIVAFVLKGLLGRGQVVSADRVRTIGADAIIVREEPPEVAPPAAAGGTVSPRVPPAVEEPIPPPAPPTAEAPVFPVVFPPLPAEVTAPAEPAEPPPSPAEPTAPCAGEVPPVLPDTVAPEGAPRSSEENAWQRWVRRLRRG